MTQSRSQRRYARAAGVVPSVTLDAECAACLDAIRADTGMSKSDIVRHLIRKDGLPRMKTAAILRLST